MSKFSPTAGFKWIDPKGFESNKYGNNSSKVCALEVDLEYPKELRKLHADYLNTIQIEYKSKNRERNFV